MMVHRVSRLLLALAVAAPSSLLAQGFGINEIGACATARAYGGTGAPCKDASLVYWNPAAGTQLPGWNISLGASAIDLSSKFSQDSTGRVFRGEQPLAYVPSAFVNYHAAGSKAAWGLGFYVPYGLTSEWGDDFPGRFMARRASLKSIYIQPNVSWQLTPKWAIGGGPVFGHSTVELTQALDLSAQTVAPGVTFGQLGIPLYTQFGTANIKGSGNAFGVTVATFAQLSPEWTFGARFLSPLDFEYNGADATFTQVGTGLVLGAAIPNPADPGGPPLIPAGTPIDSVVAPQFRSGGALVPQKASTKIIHPAQIQFGFGYTGYRNLLLSADYEWMGWKQFKEMQVAFEGNSGLNETIINDYNHTSAIRLSAEYTATQWGGTKLRGGFSGVAGAAPPETVTPMLPEQDRAYFTVGAGIPLFTGYSADLMYGHAATPGARGRTANRTSRSQSAQDLNNGVYNLSANIFSVTLKASF